MEIFQKPLERQFKERSPLHGWLGATSHAEGVPHVLLPVREGAALLFR